MKSLLYLSLLACFVSLASAESVSPDYQKELEAYHQRRLAKLTHEDGYLSLVGLHWLSDKPQEIEEIGVAWLEEGKVQILLREGHTFQGQPVDSVTLGLDKKEGQEFVSKGSRKFYAVKRGPWVGLRVKDSQALTRTGFQPIERFEPSLDWRLTGRLEAAHESVAVASVVGVATEEESPGFAVFEKNGVRCRMRLIGAPEDRQFFLVFSDASAGKSTYTACRFLTVERGEGDSLIIDFNKSINPACAFTQYATCPLPPEENVLPFAVLAGEKKPH